MYIRKAIVSEEDDEEEMENKKIGMIRFISFYKMRNFLVSSFGMIILHNLMLHLSKGSVSHFLFSIKILLKSKTTSNKSLTLSVHRVINIMS